MGTGNQGEDSRAANENVHPTEGSFEEKSSSGIENVNLYIQKFLWVLGNICRQFGK